MSATVRTKVPKRQEKAASTPHRPRAGMFIGIDSLFRVIERVIERAEGPASYLAQAKRCELASFVSAWVMQGNMVFRGGRSVASPPVDRPEKGVRL